MAGQRATVSTRLGEDAVLQRAIRVSVPIGQSGLGEVIVPACMRHRRRPV